MTKAFGLFFLTFIAAQRPDELWNEDRIAAENAAAAAKQPVLRDAKRQKIIRQQHYNCA